MNNFFKFFTRFPKPSKFVRKDTMIVLPNNCTQRFMQFLNERECEFSWHQSYETERTTFYVQYHAWKEPIIKRQLDRMAYGH